MASVINSPKNPKEKKLEAGKKKKRGRPSKESKKKPGRPEKEFKDCEKDAKRIRLQQLNNSLENIIKEQLEKNPDKELVES